MTSVCSHQQAFSELKGDFAEGAVHCLVGCVLGLQRIFAGLSHIAESCHDPSEKFVFLWVMIAVMTHFYFHRRNSQ